MKLLFLVPLEIGTLELFGFFSDFRGDLRIWTFEFEPDSPVYVAPGSCDFLVVHAPWSQIGIPIFPQKKLDLVSGIRENLFDEENLRSKISWDYFLKLVYAFVYNE